MRIGFVGNENNIPFAFARYLRDEGWDMDVLIFANEPEHFSPRADSYDDDWRAWCHRLDFGGGLDIAKLPRKKITDALRPYNILFGTNFAPAYVQTAKRSLDVFVPHGGDVSSAVSIGPGVIRRPISYLTCVLSQRRGIGSSRIIHSDFHQPEYERNIARYGHKAERWRTPFPTLYAPQYADLERCEPRTQAQQMFRELADQNDILALAPCRQIWGDAASTNPGAKGTETALAGWKRFCDARPDLDKTLMFLEYGPDVERTKGRVRELGLDDVVAWLPKLARKDLMYGYHCADIVLGEFVHSWITGGVLFESLVTNTPIVTWRDETLLSATKSAGLYEIYNARTADDIAHSLHEFLKAKHAGRSPGSSGRQWYSDKVVEPTLGRYNDLLDRLSKST